MTQPIALGFQGLGRMGMNMVRRLRQGGHRVVCYGRPANRQGEVEAVGAEWAKGAAEVLAALPPPRLHWLMVPASAVDEAIAECLPHLQPGDALIDGGNSHFRHTVRRSEELAARGIGYLDVGTSGGIWGLQIGYCLMVGGPREVFEAAEPALATLAPPDGYLHVGPSGAGHFVKMVHNGIEYGMMEAYAEGFELMQACAYDLPLPAIARLWNQGSVVRSWLLELTARALAQDPALDALQPYVEDSGEGRWTLHEAVDLAVPVPVIAESVMRRFESRDERSFALRLLAALRNQFGGHAVKPTGEGGPP